MCNGAWAALAGGVIGIAGSLGTTYFTHWLKTNSATVLDDKRKALLTSMLKNGEQWRNLGTLKRVVGADDQTTIRLLLEIGARGSQRGNDVWGLISRNPLPEGDQVD